MSGDIAVLVHGTFAREAEWIEPGGKVAAAIGQSLPAFRSVPFRWSGRNSHDARIKASRELADLIDRLVTEEPQTRIHLVGHSHGGNVILYAAGRARHAGQIAGIVSLGTPFLVPQPRHFESALDFARSFAVLPLFAIGFGPSIILAFMLAGAVASLHDWAAVLAVVAGFAISLLLGSLAARIPDFVGPRLSAALARRQAQGLANLSLPVPSCPLYIATVPADEAGLLLGFWDRLAFFPLELVQRVGNAVAGLAAGGFFAIVTGAFLAAAAGKEAPILRFDPAAPQVEAAFLDAGAWVLSILLIGGLAITALGALAVLFASLIRTTFVAFGGEHPLLVAALRIKPRIRPDWSLPPGSFCRTYRFETGQSKLRHSAFYDDPQVLADLANWIAAPKEQNDEQVRTVSRPVKVSRRTSVEFEWGCLAAPALIVALIALAWLAPQAFQTITGMFEDG